MSPIAAKLRHQLRMPHINRAVFEIAGDVLEILRHPLQHLLDVMLMHDLR